MSRWLRLYDEMVDDPKIQRLPAETFKALINLWCITSQNDGTLPSIEDIAFKLRMTPERATEIIGDLQAAGLIDKTETGITPHNWNARQYKGDVTDPTNAERQQRYRHRQRNGQNSVTDTVTAVTDTVTVKRPETETETEQIQTSLRSDATASRDIRRDLFDHGLKTLASITGKTPDSCRSLVGKWLKSVNDEAIHVLAAIEDAARNRIADPVPWINRVLSSHIGASNGQPRKRTVIDAADDLVARLQALDESADLGGGARAPPARLLPPQ